MKNKKTRSLKLGELVKVTPKDGNGIAQQPVYGLLMRRIENFLGSGNFFEVLLGQKIEYYYSADIEMVSIERHEKMDRFNTNFKSVIKSTDPDATIALEGDAIVIGASTTELQEELTRMLPEEFEAIPVIIVDMSAEEYES